MLKNRKNRLIILPIFLLIIIVSFILTYYLKTKDDNVELIEGDITRYEWIEMLCKKTGMTEYNNSEPYFGDVSQDNIYFPYIQSAVEWKILDTSSAFNGDLLVSGRDIALTAMKSIGEDKIRIYTDNKEEITDDIYIDLAMENGLIEEKQITKGFYKTDCEKVLEILDNLYFGEFWKDDYSEVVYQDGVIELSSKDVMWMDEDCMEIGVEQEAIDSLETDTIIIFEQSNTGLKIARKIDRINVDGTISLNPVELDEVVESIVVSDITELTFSDIVNYNGLEESIDTVSNLERQYTSGDLINTLTFKTKKDSKGFKLVVYTEDKGDKADEDLKNENKQLKVKITDNETGMSYDFPIKETIEADCDYNVEIDINKFILGAQLDLELINSFDPIAPLIPFIGIINHIDYIDVALDVNASFKGEIKGEVEKKIPLFKTPVPLGGGVIGVDIQIFMVLSLDGGISFEAEFPANASVNYGKGKGLRHSQTISVENQKFEASCEVASMLRIEPTVIVLGIDILDVEVDMGAAASASVTTHPNLQICSDISASLPIFTVSVCGDNDVDTLIGNIGLSAEWEIVTSENAPVKIGLHHEILPSGNTQFVDECTYDESKIPDEGSFEMNNTYHTRYREIQGTNTPAFNFNYSNNWTITKEEVNNDPMFGEIVVLTNDRGATITYTKYETEIGYESRTMTEYKAEKVADVEFKISDSSTTGPGNLVVAKVKRTGILDMDIDTDFKAVDGESFYAILPESVLEQYDGVLTSVGLLGYYDTFSFDYPTPYSLIAESPDGKFSESEEQEIIEILGSFRGIE